MSGLGRGLSFDYLSPLGQLKLAQRIIRFGMSLPTNEFVVLLAIYDRTYAWQRSEAVIPDSHFLDGIRPGGGVLMDAAPVQLTRDDLHVAIDGLVDRHAIRRFGRPLPITYAINPDWEPPGFRPMWRVEESDYQYRTLE